MRLKQYLRARGESESGFADRSDVGQSTINAIANDEKADPRISTCSKIVRAAELEPAPGGGTVHWMDLVPPGKADKGKGAKAPDAAHAGAAA